MGPDDQGVGGTEEYIWKAGASPGCPLVLSHPGFTSLENHIIKTANGPELSGMKVWLIHQARNHVQPNQLKIKET